MSGNWPRSGSLGGMGGMVVLYGASPDPWNTPREPYLPQTQPLFPQPLAQTTTVIDAKQFGELMDELRTLRHAVERLRKEVAALAGHAPDLEAGRG